MKKQGIVETTNSFGSAVYLDNQYVVTASHLLEDNKLKLSFEDGVDSINFIVFQHNDITLIKTHINFTCPPTIVATVKVNDEVYWLQTLFFKKEIVRLWFKGNVAYVDDSTIVVDRPFYPGGSGSGLFNYNMELVGIVSRYQQYENGLSLGIAEIPKFPLFIQQKIDGDLK